MGVKRLLVLASLLTIMIGLIGCGLKRPSPEEFANAYFGEFPSNYEMLIKNHMESRLFDPYSAVYKFHPPEKGWMNHWGTIYYGWLVECDINAKNRYGAYVGYHTYSFLIRDGKLLLSREGSYQK